MTMRERASAVTNEGLDRLGRIQADPAARWRATVLAFVVGALLATVHWSGLLVGGALVGLAWPSFRHALVAGLGFGVAVVVAFVARLALAGSLTATLDMGVIGVIPVLAALVGGVLGASVRGLFPDVDQTTSN
jgi:hypothetical protein